MPQYPVIMMSCKEGLNKDLLMDELEKMSAKIMGKKMTKLTYSYEKHETIQKWLFENANIKTLNNLEYNDEKGEITVCVPIDDVVY